MIRPIGGFRIGRVLRRCYAVRVLPLNPILRRRSLFARSLRLPLSTSCLEKKGSAMIEAVMFWNEPNNKSHWDFEADPEWRIFARMIRMASESVAAENPQLLRVLGGISPIDPSFIQNMKRQGALDLLDVVAVHGFPLDWNHWQINDWPEKLKEIENVVDRPVWVSEVGVSTFGAEEVQEFGLRRTAE